MATKQPALITRFKAAQTRITELESKLTAETKRADDAERMKKHYSDLHDEKETQIEQLHGLLDGMTGALPREGEGENSWDKKKYAPMTRLAAWLASRIAA
ncbi:hypothetical protein [Pandoraea commovens]|uniref:Uncharacterized protein n=1 Tax=Pandoraea commovens TaxID=2508289 RepID=A0A5E4XBK3_9BURK|nr:hypothetical protein [Pandoraea commovens]VVE33799.1 hypothetical protein PCO31010_03809 [Pandoraea commovens]